MPNHIVSGNVDTMMRAANNAAIRSAIGVGQTDAPTFLAQTLTGQSLTASQSTNLLDLATTWNTVGTPTGIKLNVIDTASDLSSLLLDCQTGGTSRFRVNKTGGVFSQNSADSGGLFSAGSNGFRVIQFGGTFYGSNGLAAVRTTSILALRDTGGFCWVDASENPATGTIELGLFKDAPGILAQRNTTNAQMFRVYNTYTDASNYERVSIGYSAGAFQILSDALGSGFPKQLQIGTNTAASLVLTTANTLRWQVTSAGHFLAVTNNAYDIGATGGVSCPRNIFAGTSIDTPLITSSASITINAGATAQGITILCSRLRIGGNTSSSPAIKQVGTGIDVVLADDTGFTAIQSLYQRFGTGSPEGAVIAPIGAIYHRTNGGLLTSFYVKESGTGNTGWVAK